MLVVGASYRNADTTNGGRWNGGTVEIWVGSLATSGVVGVRGRG